MGYKATNKTCVAFAKYCRTEFGIRYLNEIKPEMFKSFIEKGDFKTGRAYDSKTAATYFSQVQKLQNTYNSQNNTNMFFADKTYKEVIGAAEHKRNQMPSEVHDEIIKKAYENKTENGHAFEIARNLGLRVREITNLRKEDFKFDKGGNLEEVHIHKSKGGKDRDLDAEKLTETQIKVVEKVYDYYKDKIDEHERLFKNKADSYSKTFGRIRDSINDKYNQCGIHSMRKEFAQDYFNRETEEKGRDELKVKEELTQLLGHNRIEVLDAYLK